MTDLFEGDRPQPFSLHPYQRTAVERTYAAINEGARRVLVVMPTGTGKTIMFAQMVGDCTVSRGRPSLVVAHREELLAQAVAKIHQQTGIRGEIERADMRADRQLARVVVGSVPSMRAARLEEWNRGHFGLVVVDEAHHTVARTYQELVNHFCGTEKENADGSFVGAATVGVTATPDRGDEVNLGKVFQVVAYNYPLTQAIRDGYLCKIKGLIVSGFALNLEQVRISHGDYVARDLEEVVALQLPSIAEAVVEHTQDRRRTLIFTPLVGTAINLAEELKVHGIKAGFVHGEMKPDDRHQALDDFERGAITHMVNCMVLTEGYDHPAIDCVVNCRPTRSRGLFAQMIGRGTRVCEGKDHLRIINFDWKGKHDLVSAYELFFDKNISQRTRNIAVQDVDERGEPNREIEYQEELGRAVERANDPDVLARQLELIEYDPLDFIRLSGVDPESELNMQWRNPQNGRYYTKDESPGSSSEKQVWRLRNLGMTDVDGELSSAHASKLIELIESNGGRFDRARHAVFQARIAGEEATD